MTFIIGRVRRYVPDFYHLRYCHKSSGARKRIGTLFYRT